MFNLLPNNKNFYWSKSKVFADAKIDVTENLKFVHGKVENIVGEGENGGYQEFVYFFPQCFERLLSQDCATKV